MKKKNCLRCGSLLVNIQNALPSWTVMKMTRMAAIFLFCLQTITVSKINDHEPISWKAAKHQHHYITLYRIIN